MLNLSNGTQLTDADLWNLKQALAAAQAPTTTPPVVTPPVVTPPVVTPPTIGGLPAALAGKRLMYAAIANGQRIYSGGPVTQRNAWVVTFRTGAASGASSRIEAAEWQGGPLPREAVLYRKSDGAAVVQFIGGSRTTITVNFLTGVQPDAHSGKFMLDPNTDYCFALWNLWDQSGPMFADLYLY